MTEKDLKILNDFKEKAIKMIEKYKNNCYVGEIYFHSGKNFLNFEVGKAKIGLTIAYGDVNIAIDRSRLTEEEIETIRNTFVKEGYILKRFNYHKKVFDSITESTIDDAVNACEDVLFKNDKLVERLFKLFN